MGLEIQILKCSRCGALDSGPRQLCPSCHLAALTPHDVSGAGKLVSWTVIRRAPLKLKGLAPYAVCVVDLDVGVRVTGRLQAVPAPDAAIAPGMRVQCAALEAQVPLFAAEA